jgi:membrane-associated protease RseP (regulator of RpoE activity)
MIIFFFFGRILTPLAEVFLHWLYFLSINLALVNMLPIYPLDGGRMFRTYLASMNFKWKTLERVTMFGFIALVASNLVLSLLRFGFVPL